MKVTKRAGFSLIELLIALAIVIIATALLLPKFVGTLSETRVDASAVDVVEAGKAYWSAAQEYLLKTGVEATSVSDLNPLLVQTPVPPVSAKDPNYSGTYAYEISTDLNVKGSSDNDVVLTLKGINDAVCKKINEKYTGLGATIPTAPSPNYAYQCYNDGNENVFLSVLYVH